MDAIQTIISKVNAKELGKHISNYSNLYLHPITIWKQAIGIHQHGYDLIIMHIIYYFILALLLINSFQIAITAVIADVILTVIPFLILILPYIIYCKVFKSQTNYKGLFRILLIIKFQFIPVLLSIYLIAFKGEIESFYIIYSNFIWVTILFFILIPIFVLNIKLWHKIIWAVTNYFFLLIYSICFIALMAYWSDFTKLSFKIQAPLPSMEYINYSIKSKCAECYLYNSKYYLLVKVNENNVEIVRSQFSTIPLAVAFSDENYLQKNLLELMQKYIEVPDSALYYKEKLFSLPPRGTYLNNEILDSMKIDVDNRIYNDIKLSSQYFDSTDFLITKKYYGALNKYLIEYNNLYTDWDQHKNVVKDGQPFEQVVFNDKISLLSYSIDSNYFTKSKKEYTDAYVALENHASKSSFLSNIILYPVLALMPESIYDSILNGE